MEEGEDAEMVLAGIWHYTYNVFKKRLEDEFNHPEEFYPVTYWDESSEYFKSWRISNTPMRFYNECFGIDMQWCSKTINKVKHVCHASKISNSKILGEIGIEHHFYQSKIDDYIIPAFNLRSVFIMAVANKYVKKNFWIRKIEEYET